MAKGQLSFGNPIVLGIFGAIAIAILYLITVLLGQVGNLLKVFLSNFWLLSGLIIAAIVGTIVLVLIYRDKLAPKIALILAIAPAALFLIIALVIPDVAIATDGVTATVTAVVSMPFVAFGYQLGSVSLLGASVTSMVPNSPLVPTPQTFSLASLNFLSLAPPPANFIGSGSSVTVQVTATCNGQTFFNQANIDESTLLSFSGGGTDNVNVVLNNLPDHSTCSFVVSLSCVQASCSSSTVSFSTQISSSNTGGA